MSNTSMFTSYRLDTVSQLTHCSTVESQLQSQSHVTTDSQSASQSWCQAPSGAQDEISLTVILFRFCRRGAQSLTRGRIYYLLRTNLPLWFWLDSLRQDHIQNTVSKNMSLTVACVSDVAETCLSRRCLATENVIMSEYIIIVFKSIRVRWVRGVARMGEV
jgi:hypothetical protein